MEIQPHCTQLFALVQALSPQEDTFSSCTEVLTSSVGTNH